MIDRYTRVRQRQSPRASNSVEGLLLREPLVVNCQSQVPGSLPFFQPTL